MENIKNIGMTPICLVLILFVFFQTSFGQPEKITNREIIAMTQAGLGEDLIIQKIKTSESAFDLSIDALILLKQSGVTDPVVAAMLRAKTGTSQSDSTTHPGFGIYVFQENPGGGNLVQLSPNVAVQNRTGGKFTAALTPLGLGKIKTKANLPGRNAALQLNSPNPVFYFYLDAESGGLRTVSGIPYSPNEFKLVKFNLRSDNREITISKENSLGIKEGLSDEYVIEIEFEDLGNGKFKVTPKKPLENGEYAFFLIDSGTSNVSSGIGAKFFDFGVRF